MFSRKNLSSLSIVVSIFCSSLSQSAEFSYHTFWDIQHSIEGKFDNYNSLIARNDNFAYFLLDQELEPDGTWRGYLVKTDSAMRKIHEGPFELKFSVLQSPLSSEHYVYIESGVGKSTVSYTGDLLLNCFIHRIGGGVLSNKAVFRISEKGNSWSADLFAEARSNTRLSVFASEFENYCVVRGESARTTSDSFLAYF